MATVVIKPDGDAFWQHFWLSLLVFILLALFFSFLVWPLSDSVQRACGKCGVSLPNSKHRHPLGIASITPRPTLPAAVFLKPPGLLFSELQARPAIDCHSMYVCQACRRNLLNILRHRDGKVRLDQEAAAKQTILDALTLQLGTLSAPGRIQPAEDDGGAGCLLHRLFDVSSYRYEIAELEDYRIRKAALEGDVKTATTEVTDERDELRKWEVEAARLTAIFRHRATKTDRVDDVEVGAAAETTAHERASAFPREFKVLLIVTSVYVLVTSIFTGQNSCCSGR